MKLWQKNYLVTALLFTAVLFLCAAALAAPIVQMTMLGARDEALLGEKAFANVLDTMVFAEPEPAAAENRFSRNKAVRGEPSEADNADMAAALLRELSTHYAARGTYLQVERDGQTLINSLPDEAAADPGTLQWRLIDGAVYVAVGDALPNGVTLTYMRDVTERVKTAVRQGLGAVGVCLALCCLVNIALYYTMLQINKPLSRLSHELRTPLTVIRGYGELLQKAVLTEEQRHNAASYIVSECDRLKDITQKLLTLNERTVIDKTRIPLAALRERLSMTWPDVRVEINGDAITGDYSLLLSLLDNLIGNAEKAGGEVTVSLSPEGIIVRDTGRGMDAALLSYVNDPQRAERPAGIRSGLGVPLCHEIAGLHGGRLTYTSTEGKGTEARFELPG